MCQATSGGTSCETLSLFSMLIGMERREPIRKTMKRREMPGGVRFITCSCEHRLPLFLNPAIRGVFEGSLHASRLRYRFEMFAWVVMPEHIHLLLRPPPSVALARILAYIKTSVMRRVLPRWKELGAPILQRLVRPDGTYRFWQKGGGFDRNIRDEQAFTKAIHYIHRNPVERDLVKRPEDWRWSSARFWAARHERHRELATWSRSSDAPGVSDEWWDPGAGLSCDWPPGDWRSWAQWSGFM